jgi:hypothetical protein
VRHKEHVRYVRTNNPTSAYALHILNNKHEYGTAAETLELLKPCHKGTRMDCLETFYMQIFHQHKLLINEQNIIDINHLYELADTSRILLQKSAPQLSLILHSTQHTLHSQGKPARIFTCSNCLFICTLYSFSVIHIYIL